MDLHDGDLPMKNFNQERWNMLNKYDKVAVACRYCYIPYFSNLVVQTGLCPIDVHLALDHLTDIGSIKESWARTSMGWALSFRYDDHCTNGYIDMLIEGLA